MNEPDYLRLTREPQTFVTVAFSCAVCKRHTVRKNPIGADMPTQQLAPGEPMNTTPCNDDWPAQTLTCETCGRKFSSEHYSRVDVALKIHGTTCKVKK